MLRHRGHFWIAVAALVGSIGIDADGNDGVPGQSARNEASARLRRPMALALINQDRTLLVANQRSGSLSVVDPAGAAVRSEIDVGQSLADISVLPDQQHALVVDEGRHELIGLAWRDDRLNVAARLPVSHDPVTVEIAPDGSRCFVASLWSRTVTVVDLSGLTNPTGPPELKVIREIRLPFAPREQLPLPGGSRLLVADAFGGRLAVVDVERGAVESVREIPGHNIRGLGLIPENRGVLVAHQTLNPLARSAQDDIHWGLFMASEVQALALDALLDPQADLLDDSRGFRLGEVGSGAADPEELLVLGKTRVLIALGGVGHVLIANPRGFVDSRVPVGRRPTALAASADGRFAYVADALSDSISVIDAEEAKVVREIALGPVSELASAERGEQLFYDARRSHGQWFSCHSCHTDGYSNERLADTQGDLSYGNPKRVLPLGGVVATGPWAWNGGMARLEDQLAASVDGTMHGAALTGDDAADLIAYLKTIPPMPAAGSSARDAAAVERGRLLFGDLRCDRCHAPPTYTTPAVYDVGLADEAGHRRFNPPSLRGVGQRSGLFHDNRAASLEEVLTTFKHQLDRELSPDERGDLIEFLRGL